MNRIRDLRKEAGWQQSDLANMLSSSRQAVSKWETGQIDLNTDTIRRLCEIFHVSADYLLGSTVPKHPAIKITLDFPVAPHKLRRTYITRLILGGMDLRRVQYLAGHETADVTLEIYTALMGNQPEDLIDDVSAIFGA